MASLLSSSDSGSPASSLTVGGSRTKRRRRACGTHRHPLGAFREGSRPQQPPWCVFTWYHDDDRKENALCFGEGTLLTVLINGETIEDEWNYLEQLESIGKTQLFEMKLRIDLSEKLGSGQRVQCVTSCESPRNWVAVGLNSGSVVLVDLAHETVKCTFIASEECGEVTCIARGAPSTIATGHSTGEVLLWDYSFHSREDSITNSRVGTVKISGDEPSKKFFRVDPITTIQKFSSRTVALAFGLSALAMISRGGDLVIRPMSVSDAVGGDENCDGPIGPISAVEYGEPLFVSWYADEAVVTGGEDDLLWIHPLKKSGVQRRRSLEGHTCYVTGAVIAAEKDEATDFRRILSCGLDGRILLWLPNKAKVIVNEEGESFYGLASRKNEIFTLSVDPGGKWSLNRYLISPDLWQN